MENGPKRDHPGPGFTDVLSLNVRLRKIDSKQHCNLFSK